MTSALYRTSLLLAALALVACGTRTVPGPSRGDDPAPADAGVPREKEPPLRKVSVIELQLEGGQIWLSITNEVGASDLLDVGRFEGECRDDVDTTGDPDPVKGAVFAVECAAVRLRFLHREPQLVVVRAPAGTDDYEMYRSLDLPRDSRLVFE